MSGQYWLSWEYSIIENFSGSFEPLPLILLIFLFFNTFLFIIILSVHLLFPFSVDFMFLPFQQFCFCVYNLELTLIPLISCLFLFFSVSVPYIFFPFKPFSVVIILVCVNYSFIILISPIFSSLFLIFLYHSLLFLDFFLFSILNLSSSLSYIRHSAYWTISLSPLFFISSFFILLFEICFSFNFDPF